MNIGPDPKEVASCNSGADSAPKCENQCCCSGEKQAELAKTPFYDNHVASGARMVDYTGWSMPLLYTTILDEHAATRKSMTIFDVSHMGRLKISGDLAFKLIDTACTADMLTQQDDTCQYSLLCNESGGILDDLIVSRFDDSWLVVCNAANRAKVIGQFNKLNESGGFGAKIKDTTESTAMVAIQGPEAIERLRQVLPMDISQIGRRDAITGRHMMIKYIASRSGYTGEDGLEVILPGFIAGKAWKFITGEKAGAIPAGLGSRDLLRLEAGLPLYGHELTEETDPISAGLGRAVRTREGFVGFEAIDKIRSDGPRQKLVGLKLEGRRAARQGSAIMLGGQTVGGITSGAWSPSCDASIAMGYINTDLAAVDTAVEVQTSPRSSSNAVIVKRPFYRGSAFKK